MAVSSTGYVLLGYDVVDLTANPKKYKSPDRTISNYKAFPAEEVEIDPAKEFIDFREIRGSRQAMITLDGPFRPTATMKGALYPLGVTGMILAGTFGKVDPATTSGGVKTHTFGDGTTLPLFTIERADKLTGATISQSLPQCKVESLQFACAFGEKVDMTVNFQATKKPVLNQDTSVPPKPQTFFEAIGQTTIPNELLPLNNGSVVDPVIFSGAVVKWGDYTDAGVAPSEGSLTSLATIKSVNIEFTNTLTRQETLNESNDGYKLFEGGLECTLSGALVFEDLEMYNRVLSGKPVSIKLTFKSKTEIVSGQPYEIEFFWPRVKVSRASIPFTAGEVIESDVEFKVLFDQKEGYMVRTIMKNADDGYTIPSQNLTA